MFLVLCQSSHAQPDPEVAAGIGIEGEGGKETVVYSAAAQVSWWCCVLIMMECVLVGFPHEIARYQFKELQVGVVRHHVIL